MKTKKKNKEIAQFYRSREREREREKRKEGNVYVLPRLGEQAQDGVWSLLSTGGLKSLAYFTVPEKEGVRCKI